MAEKCFCHFNGYQVKDATARSANAKNAADIDAVRYKAAQNAASIEAAKAENADAIAEAKAENAENAAAIEAARSEIAVERARINNLSANSGNATEGNAELIDIRVGYDGSEYETAGAAVREQIGDLHDEETETKQMIDEHLLKKVVSKNLISSSVYTNQVIMDDGSITDRTNYCLTEYLACEENRTIAFTRIISGSSDAYVRGKHNMKSVAFYDANKNLIGVIFDDNTLIPDLDIQTPAKTKYVRIAFEKAYEATHQPMLEYTENGISEKYEHYFAPYFEYNPSIDNAAYSNKLQRDLLNFTSRFPVPQNPEATVKKGTAAGCLSDIHTVDGKDVLYGFSGADLLRSAFGEDKGTPQIQMESPASGGEVNFIKKLDDGSLLCGVENAGGSGIAKIYKGTAEAWNDGTSRFDVTWNERLSVSQSDLWFSMWFGLSIYKNVVVVGEYGANNKARSVYISRDYGDTWQKIFEVAVVDYDAGAHIHDVCYDPYSDIIWVCTGDGYWAQNIYFSYDGGESWNKNYDVKESPSQFTKILPLPSCVLFTSDNSKHMAVYRCNRSQLLAKPEHVDLDLAFNYYDNYNAESPIGSNGAIAYGKNACAFFGWAERYDAAKTNSPVIGTKDGYNFFEIWGNTKITEGSSAYIGIYGVYGVTENGNIAISFREPEEGTSGHKSVVLHVPEWKTWETMFD